MTCVRRRWAKQGLNNLIIQTEGEIQFGTSINQINITFSGDNNNFTTWNH
jgi:hypothetical protein